MTARMFFFALTVAGLSGAVRAQGLLDEQLGPPASPPPSATRPAPDAVPAKPEPRPNALRSNLDIVSPDAAKRVDDDELLNELLRPGAQPDPDAVKQRLMDMMARMRQTEQRLNNKDPGEVTQETQRRIVTDLDVMIELARQQQQNSSSSSAPQPGQARQPGQPQPGPKGEGGTQAATSDPLPRGGYADPITGDMRNRDPSSWGSLPPRDRDQVSHGSNEEYLSSYKEMIDRYYQALAEMGKARSR